MVKALFNTVLVKPIEEDESTYGNIVVPDMGKEKNLKCEVVSVGPGHYSAMGTFIDLLPALGPTKVDYKGEEYYTIQENQILAVIENE
jgi:co-chaperonin GroES (HSP10)